MYTWLNMVGLYVLPIIIAWVQTNTKLIDDFIGKEAGYGAEAVIAAVTKINAYAGGILQMAYDSVKNELPKYEGDAVAWILAVLEAEYKKLQGKK